MTTTTQQNISSIHLTLTTPHNKKYSITTDNYIFRSKTIFCPIMITKLIGKQQKHDKQIYKNFKNKKNSNHYYEFFLRKDK